MTPPARGPLRFAWIPVVSASLSFLFGIFAAFFAGGPWYRNWDDAYMFVRYADNLRACGVVTWNQCEGATYGLTSLAHFGVVATLRAFFRGDPSVPLTLASMGAGCVLVALVVRRVARVPGPARPATALFVAGSLAWAVTHLRWHFQSGMDTTLAMLTAWLFVEAARRVFREAGGAPRGSVRAAVLGGLGGLAWLVRPELPVIFGVLLATIVVVSPHRRRAFLAGLALGATTALCIGAAWLYFRTPFPLPFRAKSLSSYAQFSYDPAFGMAYEAKLFFRGNVVIVAAALMRVLFDVRRGRRDGVALGVLFASLAITVFLVARMHAIMAFEQRFFMPLLPMLLAVGIDAVEELAPAVATARPPLLAVAFAAATLAVPPLVLLRGRQDVMEMLERPGRVNFAVREVYERYAFRVWPHLPAIMALPDDVAVATTEVGIISVLLPRNKVIDLAGLNDARFAIAPFDPARLLAEDHPDVIYLPHPNYVGMNRALLADPTFQAEYQWVPHRKEQFGFAIRKHGRHAEALRSAFFPQP